MFQQIEQTISVFPDQIIKIVCDYAKTWQNQLKAIFLFDCSEVTWWFQLSKNEVCVILDYNRIILYDLIQLEIIREYKCPRKCFNLLKLDQHHLYIVCPHNDWVLNLINWEPANVLNVPYVSNIRGNKHAKTVNGLFLGFNALDQTTTCYEWQPDSILIKCVYPNHKPIGIRDNGDIFTKSNCIIFCNGCEFYKNEVRITNAYLTENTIACCDLKENPFVICGKKRKRCEPPPLLEKKIYNCYPTCYSDFYLLHTFENELYFWDVSNNCISKLEPKVFTCGFQEDQLWIADGNKISIFK